jgi:hypothetical protein
MVASRLLAYPTNVTVTDWFLSFLGRPRGNAPRSRAGSVSDTSVTAAMVLAPRRPERFRVIRTMRRPFSDKREQFINRLCMIAHSIASSFKRYANAILDPFSKPKNSVYNGFAIMEFACHAA